MQKYLLLVLAILVSCQSRQSKPQKALLSAGSSTAKGKNATGLVKPTVNDFFADSTNIGSKAHNKIEIASYSTPDSDYVITRFYAKLRNGWGLRNSFTMPQDKYLSTDPQLSDFNGDGFNDITYESLRAARGANEVRKLFVYDKTNDKLVYIKNSEDYPNMQYNKALNCVDAFLVSGCNVTVFLKIEKDTLRELADVDQCDMLTVTTYDKKGKGKVILQKKANKADITRYTNYRPLE